MSHGDWKPSSPRNLPPFPNSARRRKPARKPPQKPPPIRGKVIQEDSPEPEPVVEDRGASSLLDYKKFKFKTLAPIEIQSDASHRIRQSLKTEIGGPSSGLLITRKMTDKLDPYDFLLFVSPKPTPRKKQKFSPTLPSPQLSPSKRKLAVRIASN